MSEVDPGQGENAVGFQELKSAMETHQLTEEMVLHVRRMAEENLYFFSKFILGYEKIVPHIHLPLCQNFQNPANKRLWVCIPRGWFKTTIYSISGPLWEGTKDPNRAILIAQNTATNAEAKLSSLANHVEENSLYRGLWPHVLPDRSCVWRNDSKCLKRTKGSPESTFEAVGVRNQITSRHYNHIIEDDTIAPDLDEMGLENVAPNKEDIEKAIGWHRLAPPLLRSQKEDRITVVGTRWFPDDLLEWVRLHEPKYIKYIRACRENGHGEADSEGRITFPEQFDEEVLRDLETTMGPYLFRCLYLNQPVRTGDMTFDPGWTRYYDTLPKGLVCYTTVDPSGDPEETIGEIDYNAVVTTGIDPRTGWKYVLDYTRGRMNPGELIDELFKHVEAHSPIIVGVETIAYQNTLAYHIKVEQRRRGKFFQIENLSHGRKAKNARIQGLQPFVKAGTLLFAPWMKELLGEMAQFPLGKHDDVLDALAMQIRFWRLHTPTVGATMPVANDGFTFDPEEARRSVKRGMAQAGLLPSKANYLTDLLTAGGLFDGR